jgi:DNA polymerase III subunit alpha
MFVHLHTHSHYSLLGAVPKIKPLVAAAKEDGQTAMALTDNGNMYGAIEFYDVCIKNEIKPIIGVDAYLAARSRFDMDTEHDLLRHRLVLLAENNTGYKNLIRLVTKSYNEGYFRRPRMDKELLEKHHEGLIALIPAHGGEHLSALRADKPEEAAAIARAYQDIFGKDNTFLEITHHPELENHEYYMQQIKTLATSTSIPLVAAQNVYYLSPEDREAREVMLNIQNEVTPEEEGYFEEENFSFITQKEAQKRFKEEPEALAATTAIAERCTVTIELGKWYFPDLPIASGRTPDEELRHLAVEGVAWRGMTYEGDVKKRLDYELDVIQTKGYSVYFLAVGDLLRESRERGILTTIRGSVAGSLATYVLGITNVDPLKLNLPFERFLNPHRPSAPDIDMDFADNRRDEIIAYAKEKYGKENVAQIGTFGTMMARAAVRDVARALGYSYGIGDKIAKAIPFGSQGFPMTISHALETEKEFADLYKKDADTKRIVDLARKIEGCARHVGVHAAGVVIAPESLDNFVPVQPDPKGTGKYITQYDMHGVGEDGVGLLKFDFLGLKNLAIIADALARVKQHKGVDIDIENIPLDDTKTFEMLARGDTGGVFQMSGAAMTRYLKELKPNKIEDLNAMIALYRPGPMNNIPEYIARKQGRAPVKYFHPKAKNFLEPSYGILVYQDDLLFTALELAGYNWETVDKFRKAVGKKIPEEMAKQHVKFVEGCMEHSGMSKKDAEAIWDLFEPFQGYGFNKCVSGDTRVYDTKTGASHTVAELYEKKRHIHTLGITPAHTLTAMPIDAVAQNGVKQTYTVRLRSGRTLTATGNHPLYTFGKWKTIDQLAVGERVAVARTLPEPQQPSALPEHHAALLGYLIAEGNLCHPHGLYLYSKNEDELADMTRLAEKTANARISRCETKAATALYIGQQHQRQRAELRELCRSLGMLGNTATQKCIPAPLHTLPQSTLAILLGKMWQGDGCVSVKNAQTYYATSSEQLAHDVQHLLLRFSIQSTLHTKQFRYRGTHKTGYTIVVSGREHLLHFARSIGAHLIGTKKELLTTLLSQSEAAYAHTAFPARGTADTIPAPILSLVRLEMARAGVAPTTLAATVGIAPRLLHADTKKRGYRRELIGAIGAQLSSPLLTAFAESDLFWDEIQHIEPAGTRMTYDLSVPPHHNFLANDIITHNSHAASYGKVAYQTAYMKAHYPVEYMAAILTADSGDIDKVSEAVAECERLNIRVLKPDVNESAENFTCVTYKGAECIRFGLGSIKNFGDGVATHIMEERTQHGQFSSLGNFLSRVHNRAFNKKSLEALIKCGALDAFGYSRGQLLANIEALLAFHKEQHQDTTQSSLFGGTTELTLTAGEEASTSDMLKWEKELLGLYVSGHPLDEHAARIATLGTTVASVKGGYAGVEYKLAGLLTHVKPFTTKKGDKMAFIEIADKTGSIEGVIFPKLYHEHRNTIVPDACVALKGKVNERNGERSFVVEAVKGL